MARQNLYPKVVGVRLSEADGRKLKILCTHAHRAPSELVRLLIRTAQPVDVAPLRFDAPVYAALDGGSLVKDAENGDDWLAGDIDV